MSDAMEYKNMQHQVLQRQRKKRCRNSHSCSLLISSVVLQSYAIYFFQNSEYLHHAKIFKFILQSILAYMISLQVIRFFNFTRKY
jgi:hypothetical protein